jgi:ABC-type transport system involved in multi-copper enzyme maturation permease subunit
MRNPFHTPFIAVFKNEVRLNSKRAAPYASMVLFAANALLWWAKGPAGLLGWATNSEYYIVRNLKAFSFLLGPPIFNAVIMGDAVLRDFRTGIDPLIFSKPVSRAQYLLGKFFGSFFVLVCCQAVFPLTLFVLQAFRPSGMVVQPFRVLPYFKHFIFFVVITHLILAAVYFTVGTLTRNSKIVYGLAVCFYPVYIAFQLFLLKGAPARLRILLDPFLLNEGPRRNGFGETAEYLNRLVVTYTGDMIANRVLVILVTGVCLTILYLRFTMAERTTHVEKFSLLNLSTASERVYYDLDSFQEARGVHPRDADSPKAEVAPIIPLPEVARANEGFRANFNKLIAAVGVEFRLLLAERSVVVIMPLAVAISTLEVAFWNVAPDPSYSAAYAANTAKSLLLFLLGLTIFYAVEAIHRDRDLRIESLLWSQAGPNYVLLLSKFLGTLMLTAGLIVLVAVITIALQVLKHNGPVELSAYVRIFILIVIPNAIFLAAAVMVLGILIRSRYLTYGVAIGICAGLFYLYSQGQTGWIYNPLLFQLWKYSDLTGGGKLVQILMQRIHLMAIALCCLTLANLFFRRPTNRGLLLQGRLTGAGWSVAILFIFLTVSVAAGLLVNSL